MNQNINKHYQETDGYTETCGGQVRFLNDSGNEICSIGLILRRNRFQKQHNYRSRYRSSDATEAVMLQKK